MQTPFRKKLLQAQRGHDLLRSIEAIDLVLENGEKATVRIADELVVPDDPRELAREARRAPGQLAFWAYQTERALAALRARERQVAEREADEYMIARSWIQEHTTVEVPTEGNIRARLLFNQSPELKAAKDSLAEDQFRYGVLRALKDASEHRSHLLRRLIAHDTEAG